MFIKLLKELLLTCVELKTPEKNYAFNMCKKEDLGMNFYFLDFKNFSTSYMVSTWENKEVEPILYVFRTPFNALSETDGEEFPIAILNEKEILDEVDAVMADIEEEW